MGSENSKGERQQAEREKSTSRAQYPVSPPQYHSNYSPAPLQQPSLQRQQTEVQQSTSRAQYPDCPPQYHSIYSPQAQQQQQPSPQRQQTEAQQSTSRAQAQHPDCPPLQQLSLERTPAPYSYTSGDLDGTIRQANSLRLYPNLENVNKNLPPQQKVESPVYSVYPDKREKSSGSGLTGRSEEGYVIINQHQQRVQLKPSAPPAADVVGLPATPSNFNPTKPSQLPSQPRFEPNNPGPSHGSTAIPANDKANRPRSGSRGRVNDRADDRLNCPTCSKRLGLTIFNCVNRHGSCRECREGNKICGTCRCAITQMRNIALEEYVAKHHGTRASQCQNANCTLRFDIVGMEKHLKECPFGEMDCPMGTFLGQCSHRCKVDAMASHFDDCHKEQRVAEFDKEMFIFNISMEAQKLYLIKNGPYNFLVHIKVAEKDRMIYMAVQLLGTAISSSKWIYEFHVYNKRQPRRKFQYVDKCKSIGTPLNSIFKELECLALPIPYAMTFVNDSTLTYKFFIKKIETQPRTRNNHWKRQNADD